MKRGKFVSFIRKFCAVLSLCVCIFAAGYCLGLRGSVQNALAEAGAKAASAGTTAGEYTGGYSAILSGKWLYIYTDTGSLYDAVYVYTEYMTDEDKTALSCGVDFANEAEMLSFMEGFR